MIPPGAPERRPYRRRSHSDATGDLTGRYATNELERRTSRTAFKLHLRSSGNGKHTTLADHIPSSHRRYADWTIDRIRGDAALIGPATASLCELILEQRPHPE